MRRQQLVKPEGQGAAMSEGTTVQRLLVSILVAVAICASAAEASGQVTSVFVVVRQLHCVF